MLQKHEEIERRGVAQRAEAHGGLEYTAMTAVMEITWQKRSVATLAYPGMVDYHGDDVALDSMRFHHNNLP
jgi:hypothetical protein